MAESDIESVMALLQSGHAAFAENECRRLLDSDPDDEMALTLLGMAHQQQGRSVQAAVVYERLTWLYPAVSEHWNNYATTLREAGQPAEAERAYQVALKLAPDNAVTLGNLGLLYKEQSDYPKARDYLLRATHGRADDIQICIYAAMACYECGDNKTLEMLIADWRRWPLLDGELRLDLAWLLAQLGRTIEAEQLLDDLLDTNSFQTRSLVRKVLLLERVNRLDEAKAILANLPDPEKITDENERNEVIGAMGVMAQRGKEPAVTRELLERLLDLTLDPRHRSNLYFALAKACDKAGDQAAVLSALEKAHSLQLVGAAQLAPELLLPEVQPIAPALLRMTPAQTADWEIAERDSSISPPPIFVVGFPRSGTTMLEQMLDAHPALVSMDEQPFMQNVSDKVVELGYLYPEALGELDSATCESLRQLYWDQVKSKVVFKPGQRLVDKNPLTLLHLPLICRLFPDAPIILALRHPCDVILSCYMQNFRSPAFQILCSSLERLARGYVNAMQYWIYHERLLKPRVLHLRYEDLLDNFDTEVDRIGAFIKIDDAAALHGFHLHAQQKGFISTPSYAQVTQPPNKTAVGRWQRYESAFKPLLPSLKGVMEHWGYDS
ncbi:sulfotransferase [Rhodanobacter sp. A1T4]|uniref:tetratricopeptide repeat-containing sulfotransferase family protein n=1 Tax=Rhodanobacter sp. A1T4 TaxID=2723087 RepID=UPI00161BEF9E|nr:sulfotransferase [Rhodanobacter sp. A1T4]MBB6246769.1 tetratricopeptide (TPR) repeat protein [Rhodanobacter sp. A1T4]